MSIRPDMIVLARESRGLTQSELARKVKISPAMMSRIEGGVRGVSDEILGRLARALDYPHEFFSQPESIIGFGTSELFHRRQQAVSQRSLARIHANINIRRIHIARLMRGAEMPPLNIPEIEMEDYHGRIEDAAQAVRAWWNLPPGPIQNVTLLLENAGCLIVPFDFGSRKIEAISQWPPGMPPLIFVNPESPGDRERLTLVHELAHLILHRHGPEPDMEGQAFLFASEFLMPEREIKPFLRELSLSKLATLKSYWKMSMAALLKRAEQLGTITQRQAKRFWLHMSKAGYRMREPAEVDVPWEEPSLYEELIDVYRKDHRYEVAEFARTVTLHDHEAAHIYYHSQPRLRVVQ